jgi:diketogulonate reductase-like aldo/keto reductase
MIKLPQSKVRAIGVSNFTPEHIKAIIDATGVCPVVNQVERHPLLQQNDTLVKYAKEKGIHITAYSVSVLLCWSSSTDMVYHPGIRQQQRRGTASSRAPDSQAGRGEPLGHPCSSPVRLR